MNRVSRRSPSIPSIPPSPARPIGVLQVNELVSFKVLFQRKRYAGPITPTQVRDFRGAMMGRADKGIVLTTGSFTAEARREALRDGVPPIDDSGSSA